MRTVRETRLYWTLGRAGSQESSAKTQAGKIRLLEKPPQERTAGLLKPQCSPLEVFLVALRLGLSSFGGPIAHLGYFHDEYVSRRQWLDEKSYADAVAFAQSIPGATSSQVGIIVGTSRAGLLGGLAAWIGFTMPSAIALIIFGYTIQFFSGNVANAGWLHGLKIAAVVIVAQAVWRMSRTLAPDQARGTIAVGSAIVAWALEGIAIAQVAIIATAGLVGWSFLRLGPVEATRTSMAKRIPRQLSILSLISFFTLLGLVPVLRQVYPNNDSLAIFGGFYQSGALVFGGGHVVLPLLNAVVVSPGWVTSSQFLAGYGMTQAMPGPLFTFSAFLGTIMTKMPNGVAGGLFALFSIFLPSFLLVYGLLPFWDTLRTRQDFQSTLRGINAAVVGILFAALYSPVFTTSVTSIADFALTLVLGALLMVWKRPPWNIVVGAVIGGTIIGVLGLL